MTPEETHKTKGPLGGHGKTVEADETFVGGKAKNRAHSEPAPKKAVFTLIERDGAAWSFHVANINASTLRPLLVRNASRKSTLNTDEASMYVRAGREFAADHAVDHSRDEYAYEIGKKSVTINAENYFSILKRGIYGVYHFGQRGSHEPISWPSSISDIRAAPNLASTIQSAPKKRYWARKVSASLIISLRTKNRGPEKRIWTPPEKSGRPPDMRRRKRWAPD